MDKQEVWYTLDDIELSENTDRLYCISVDSEDKQFLAGEIGVPSHNTEAGKEEDSLKGEAGMIIGSIARLGRAAGVHLIIATQRPDAKIISGETKANLGVRVNAGRTDSNASNMILGTSDGVRVKAHPKGRLYLSIYGKGDHGQGFFADQEWIDNWLAEKGLNPDGTPLDSSKNKSKLANVTDMSEFDGSDLDSKEGVDNQSIIEGIREEEATDFVNGMDDEPLDSHEDDSNEIDWDDEDEDYSNSSNSSQPSYIDEEIAAGIRPDLSNVKTNDKNPWDRPEDDWDGELEDLIDENFDE